MKKLLAFLLMACMAAALFAACGKPEEPEATEPDTTTVTETAIPVVTERLTLPETEETTIPTTAAAAYAAVTTAKPTTRATTTAKPATRATTTAKPTTRATTTAKPTTKATTVTTKKEPYIFYVYQDDGSGQNHYPDIAYMGSSSNGDDGSMSIGTGCTDNPKSGGSCIKITYEPTYSTHWAGMMWLSGNQNFPPNPPVKGVDASRATKLTFWARGNGRVKFFIEDNTGDQVSQYIRLTDGWQQYALNVPSSWKTVCLGFGWAANYDDAGGGAMTFYVDEIRYEGVMA